MVPVAVYASDPLAALGIAALLRGLSDFAVLPRQQDADAEVVVLAAESVTSDFVETVRRLVHRVRARFVFILDDERAIELLDGEVAVLNCGSINATRLAHAVRDAECDDAGSLLATAQRVRDRLFGRHSAGNPGLDARETDLLRLLSLGFSLREISDELNYSERTIKNVLHSLVTRLGLRNRTQAVAYAMRVGLI